MLIHSRLMAISDHSSEMKSPQKQAFVKRLLQSNVAGDVPSWPPYFLSSILPLLPHLPVSYFQQLTSEQVSKASESCFSCVSPQSLKVICPTAYPLDGDVGEQQSRCRKGTACTSYCFQQGQHYKRQYNEVFIKFSLFNY